MSPNNFWTVFAQCLFCILSFVVLTLFVANTIYFFETFVVTFFYWMIVFFILSLITISLFWYTFETHEEQTIETLTTSVLVTI